MYKDAIKQEHFNQNKLTVASVKKDFDNLKAEEVKYYDEDSAKKRAVKQGMDYDNFRQMVLGAQLKSIKPGAINEIYGKEYILNTLGVPSKVGDEEELTLRAKNVELIEENIFPQNAMEFDKNISRLPTMQEQFIYAIYVGNDNYDIIFEKNIDGELIMKVYKLFNSFLEETERIEDEVSNRIICFLQRIGDHKEFKFLKAFFSKKEKQMIVDIIAKLSNPYKEPEIELLTNLYK